MVAYICKSGKHYWTSKADADRCCNGWHRELIVNPNGTYYFKWVKDEVKS